MAVTYNNIASVHIKQRSFRVAVQFYEKARLIMEENLPQDHKDLGLAYNNIGLAYYYLEQNSLALSFFKKALEIYRKSLPDNHERVEEHQLNINRLQVEIN